MSDENDERIAALVEKTNSMVDAVKEIAVGVSALLQFQAAQTARNEADKEWRKRVESHQDRQDDRIEAVETTSMQNSLIINGATGVIGLVSGGVITYVVSVLGG